MSWRCDICGDWEYDSKGCIGCRTDPEIDRLTNTIQRIRALMLVEDHESALKLTEEFEPILTMEI